MSNDDDSDPFTVARDFGFVAAGTTVTLPISILNGGDLPLTFNPSITGPFRVSLPASVGVDEFVQGTMEYTAATPGPAAATGDLGIGDACILPMRFDLRAGVGPDAIIEPAAVTVTAPAPASVSAPLRVTNPGNQPLRISCTESFTTGSLQISPSELTIAAGATDAFTVAMVAGPSATGISQRDIHCTTNAPVRGTRDTTITLTVTAAQ